MLSKARESSVRERVGKYDSILVAEYLLAQVGHIGRSLNQTQLQKLLYMLYGMYSVVSDTPLMDEQPKVWPYGPVFPNVRNRVQLSQIKRVDDEVFSELRKDDNLSRLIQIILEKYINTPAAKLTEWSHMKGSPWHKVTSEGAKWNTPIPNDVIKSYFRNFLND